MVVIWGGDEGEARGVRGGRGGPVPDPAADLVGDSQGFLNALAAVRRRIGEGSPVILLTGEAGTGKTVFARSVHYRGANPSDPFLTLQCSLLPPELIEAELFGAAAGVLPGQAHPKPGLIELAGHGTIFLDDVEVLPGTVQRRLMELWRAEAHAGHHRCRFVAASRFWPGPGGPLDPLLPDFHALLSRHAVELPPLRKRERDLELLLHHFLTRWAEERGRPVPRVEPDAVAALYAHPWPGNVRELKTTVERGARLAPGNRIRIDHIQIQTREHRSLAKGGDPAADMILIPAGGKSLDEIEREALLAALRLAGGNRSAAARLLRISRGTMVRKLKSHGVEVGDE